MNESLLNRILKDHKRRTRSLALILCLSMIVSLGTFAGFHQTAIAKVYTRKVLDCPYAREGAEPVAHVHNDDCYDGGTLVCTLPDREAHTHDDSCYAESRLLTCGLEENPGHQHSEECFDENGELICQIPEGEGAHAHTDDCYTIERALVCNQAELPVHVHDAGCFRTEEITVDEPEEAIEPEQPVNTVPEMPVSDPNADLETSDDWNREFENLELSGNWARDLVLVAATQQGRGESPNNFEAVLNDAGDAWVRHGYTRYGAWYGYPYAEWDAMFVSFCLRYAGIPAENVPNNPTAALMAESFSMGGLFAGRDYVPAVGDLIFFDSVDDEITTIDHMGIVYHVDAENGTINVVEGDRTEAVATFGYYLNDEQIVGYGILPQNPNFVSYEGENTDNTDEAFDGFIFMTTDEEEEPEETTATEEAPAPAAPMPAQSWERTAGGIKVSVEAPEGAFPENTRIAVTPVNGSSLKDTVSDAVSGEVLEVQAVDITFFDAEGREIEPAVPIRVVMTPAATEHAEEKTSVVHVDIAQQTAELIEQAEGTETDNSEVVFDADAFTIYAIVYTVDFEYEVDGKVYTSSMPGAQDIALQTVLEALGVHTNTEKGYANTTIESFMASVADVRSTDESVVSVGTDWTIRVLKDGDAGLVITMKDGAVFTVKVSAEGETEVKAENVAISTVGGLYLPENAVANAEVVDGEAAIEAVKAETESETVAESESASATEYTVFDISLDNVNPENYEGFEVTVALDSNITGKDFRLYHVHGDVMEDITGSLALEGPVDENGVRNLSGFTFKTGDFSEFVLSYTVDFFYGQYEYHLRGGGMLLLSDLFRVLGIDKAVDDVSEVVFSNPEVLTVSRVENNTTIGAIKDDLGLAREYSAELAEEEINAQTVRAGDWALISVRSFVTEETLGVMMKNGDMFEIRVTDPPEGPSNESTNLSDFLTKVTVSGASVVDGHYVVQEGQTYGVTLTFKESPRLQFDNDATLTYTLPEGVILPTGTTTTIHIAIVSGGRTYEIPATVTANKNGTITVEFDQTDENYFRLADATNVSFRVSIDAQFTEDISKTEWGARAERDIILDTTDDSDAYVTKSAVFDETTGKFTYTIQVTASGNPENVNVKDIISGNALIFNNDVSITGNSSNYTTNSVSNGFDYTFASMQDGEVITITYSATVNPEKASDAKITADQTKNTVTSQKEGGEPHTAEYSHGIDLVSLDKHDGTASGATQEGDKIYTWTIDYNPMALVSVAGDTIIDTIASDSQAYMSYYGDVTVKVYDSSGTQVDTRTFTPDAGVTSWNYTIPSGDTEAYHYVFEYQTIVDQSKVDQSTQSVQLKNDVSGGGKTDSGGINVGPTESTSITKAVESSSSTEVTWVSTVHVPAAGLSAAVVTDTFPSMYAGNIGLDGNYTVYDAYKDGTLEITGRLPGESYDVTVTDDKVVITFYKDSGKTQAGLQGTVGGHDITIRLTTNVDPDWLKYGYEHPGDWTAIHRNTIGINGTNTTAEVTFAPPTIKKTGSKEHISYYDPNLGQYGTQVEGDYYLYTITLSGVSETPLVIEDTFDTSLLEVPVGLQDARNFKIWGGDQWSQHNPSINPPIVNYSDTANGILITANDLPMQPNGEYYPYYKIQYFLKLKDGVDLEDLAIENGGSYDLTNTATWGDHTASYTFTTTYDFLDKKLLKEASSSDRQVKYQITFNPAKAELNGGNNITMTDTLNENLSVDYTSISITTDPEGAQVSYTLGGAPDGSGGTLATYTIPDSTKVVITYNAMVVGKGEVHYKNVVEANGQKETVERTTDIDIEGEGEGATADLKVVKLDGNDASKKLEGVQFKLYSADTDENGNRYDLSLDNSGVYEMTLTTDENGVLPIDGTRIKIYFGVKYYLEEIAAPEGYQNISFAYQFTLVDDMDEVDYSHYIYFYSDSFQIKNWPLEGLVVGKEVESSSESDYTKSFTFDVSILTDTGAVDTSINQKYGDMTFVDGVATFTLKDGEQVSAWNMPAGTKFKVKEKNTEGYTVSTTVGETTSEGSSYTGTTSSAYTLVTFTNTKEEEEGYLKIHKEVTYNGIAPLTAEQKSALAGTYTFKIYTDESCSQAVKDGDNEKTLTVTIGEDGAAADSEKIALPVGTYWIQEQTPSQTGVTPDENPLKISITKEHTSEAPGVVSFVNNREDSDNPDELAIEVRKTFTGLTDASKIPSDFKVVLTYNVPDSSNPVTVEFTGTTVGHVTCTKSSDGMTWQWRVTPIPSNATGFAVSESNYDVTGYTRTTKINGNTVENPGESHSISVLVPTITMTNATSDYTTTDNNKVFTVADNQILLVRMTNNATVIVSQKSLSIATRSAIEKMITDNGGKIPGTDGANAQWVENYVYFSHEIQGNSFSYGGRTIYFEGNTVKVPHNSSSHEVRVDIGFVSESAENSFTLENDYSANPITIEIEKVKKDDTTIKLPGAVFTLRQIADAEPVNGVYTSQSGTETRTSDPTAADTGRTSFANLSSGYYELKETVAPSGYVLTEETVTYFKISGGVLTWLQKGEGKPSTWTEKTSKVNGELISFTAAVAADPENGGAAQNAAFTVENTPGVQLPQTGGIGTSLFTTLGAILASTAGAILAIRRKRKTA